MKKEEKHITDQDAKQSLPTDRKEVFFDLLRNRKMTLFALSCYTFMFFIPLAVDLIYFNFVESMAISAEKFEYLFSLIFYSMLIMLPCMVIGFIGLAGAFYTAKKLVWQEGVSLASDFFKGIKENWKHALINGVIFGLVLFGLIIGGSFMLIYADVHAVVRGIAIGALIVLFLIFGMVTVLNFTQGVYYENSFGVTLKNSFSFLGLLNWKVLVIYLLSTGVVVTLGLFNFLTLVIGLLLFAVLNSVVIVLYTLISHSAFDKYINQEHYPDMVNKGLYKVSQDDKEA